MMRRRTRAGLALLIASFLSPDIGGGLAAQEIPAIVALTIDTSGSTMPGVRCVAGGSRVMVMAGAPDCRLLR